VNETRELLLDANVMLRFLVGDPADQSERVADLLLRAEREGHALIVQPFIVAEVFYVLASVYRTPRRKAVASVAGFLNGPSVDVEDEAIVMDAIARYLDSRIDFADCLLAAQGAGESISVASFDRDLDRFDDVQRLEP